MANRDAEYKLAIEECQATERKFVVNCWRMLDSARLHINIGYFAWGCAGFHMSSNGQAAPETIAQSDIRVVVD